MNRTMLKRKMKNRAVTGEDMADLLGLSLEEWDRRLRNGNLTAGEAFLICAYLGLDPREAKDIFFGG